MSIQLWHGDCLERFKGIEDGSVTAFVCDPPYGLEFMGKEWDSPWKYTISKHGFSDGAERRPAPSFSSSRNPICRNCGARRRTWQGGPPVCSCATPVFDDVEQRVQERQLFEEWCCGWLAECYRCLCNGGIIKVFGGTRMYHRKVMAMRRVGFIDVRLEGWVFACLSEDTEVLTDRGWRLYCEVKDTDIQILIYDVQNDIYKWEKPERWYIYRLVSDTLFRIKSDSTDQLVSRGHRCLVEREGELVFVQADKLNRLERVPTLPDDFSLLPEGWPKVLQPTLQRVLPGPGMGETCLQSPSSPDGGVGGVRTGKNDGCAQPSMERWVDLPSSQGGLRVAIDQVCSLSSEVRSEGPQGWLCDGTSTKGGDRDWARSYSDGVRPSYQPRCDGQPAEEPHAVSDERGPQEVRARTTYRTSLATVDTINYSGMIFCPKVSTGAFVARRNGKIFITGNSGFPKSTNISKQIDRQAGAERQVIGTKRGVGGENMNDIVHGREIRQTTDKGGKGVGAYGTGAKQVAVDVPITAPATELAILYDGYGTALKPAFEPIVVGRKPV